MRRGIRNLIEYLERKDVDEGSVKPTTMEQIQVYLYGPRKDNNFPWNKLTCSVVVCYVVKFCSDSENREFDETMENLESLADLYMNAVNKTSGRDSYHYTAKHKQYYGEIKETGPKILDKFLNSFMPQVQKFFIVPKLHQLSDEDKHLKPNEILASFLDFLIQMLHREANVNSVEEEELYALLRKALAFHLAILGDKPFECSTHHDLLQEERKVLLAEFEALASEVGQFMYSCVFSNRLLPTRRFYAGRDALLKKFELLNANIKRHCIMFSELPAHVILSSNVVDSFFIIHSLIEDLENSRADEDVRVKDQIKMLHDELIFSQEFLKAIEARQGDVGGLREPLVQIRDLAYEAEYLINSRAVGNIPAWYLNLRLPSVIQNIKLSHKRLQRIKEMQESPVVKGYSGEVNKVTHVAIDDNVVVDLKDSRTEKILADLIGKPKSQRQTILILGMPGLGKTTAASNLYNCSSALHYFDQRVWCVVSQTYSVRTLLVNILRHVSRELREAEILKMSDAELGVLIHKSLKQRRYLIVLDDVWHSQVWYDLKRYLPDDGNGSRAILTSRIKDAAPDGSIFHTLPLLSNDQCWDILKKKVFQKEPCPVMLLDIGKGIAAKCSGMPLAVVVAAGILVNLEKEESTWRRVERQLDAYLLDGRGDYKKILELSYEHLPHNIKPCFLYFAAFPEDTEISVNKLFWWWISEGFILKKGEKSPEEIAEMYLLELMNRSLVLPEKTRSDGGTKTCRIHDLLLDICIMKANEEKFLHSGNELFIYDKHQRSCLPSTWYTDLRPFGFHCRSLIGGLPNKSSCFQTRPLLKVMDILPHQYQEFCSTSFDLPVKLRYLGINHLTDRMVANLDNLEIIYVLSYSRKINVPSNILRMRRLRHLLIKRDATIDEDSPVPETTNLRSLLYVCIFKRKDEEILRRSPHLKKLKCKCAGETIFPDLSALTELETLKMSFKIRHGILPNINFLPLTIKKLCLCKANLPWEKMSIIGRLPSLCVLKLENHAFVGKEWETTDDEFQNLRFLKIEQNDLQQWSSCSEHFPRLERLMLINCWYLSEIPNEFGQLATLDTITLIDSSRAACLSAIQIEEEQRSYGNEELKVLVTHSKWSKEQLVQECRTEMG